MPVQRVKKINPRIPVESLSPISTPDVSERRLGAPEELKTVGAIPDSFSQISEKEKTEKIQLPWENPEGDIAHLHKPHDLVGKSRGRKTEQKIP